MNASTWIKRTLDAFGLFAPKVPEEMDAPKTYGICVCCGARETASSRDPQHPAFVCVGPTELADYNAVYARSEYEPL